MRGAAMDIAVMRVVDDKFRPRIAAVIGQRKSVLF